MKKTAMNKRFVIHILRLVFYYPCQPAQVGLRPLRRQPVASWNPMVYIIYSRSAGMTT